MKAGHVKLKTETPFVPKRLTRLRILNSSSEDEETDKNEEQMEPRVSAKADKDCNITSLTKDQTLHQKCSVPKPQESHAKVCLDANVCLSEQSDFHPQSKDQCKPELVGEQFQIMLKVKTGFFKKKNYCFFCGCLGIVKLRSQEKTLKMIGLSLCHMSLENLQEKI